MGAESGGGAEEDAFASRGLELARGVGSFAATLDFVIRDSSYAGREASLAEEDAALQGERGSSFRLE